MRGAESVVMAGDPCQLPPTVISRGAEEGGLQVTLFDRLCRLGEGPNRAASCKSPLLAHCKFSVLSLAFIFVSDCSTICILHGPRLPLSDPYCFIGTPGLSFMATCSSPNRCTFCPCTSPFHASTSLTAHTYPSLPPPSTLANAHVTPTNPYLTLTKFCLPLTRPSRPYSRCFASFNLLNPLSRALPLTPPTLPFDLEPCRFVITRLCPAMHVMLYPDSQTLPLFLLSLLSQMSMSLGLYPHLLLLHIKALHTDWALMFSDCTDAS